MAPCFSGKPWSIKLLREGYIGDKMGKTKEVLKRDTRSLDCSSGR